MNRPRSSLWPLAAVLLPALLVVLGACGDGDVDGAVDGEVELVPEGEDFFATICFPAADGLLRCEPRAIPAAGTVEETAAVIVQALIDGPDPTARTHAGDDPPPPEEVFPALPSDVGLQAFDLVNGVAYVDLTVGQTGAALRSERPAMGLREELLAVYSLVNSLTASNLGIERVVLMWNGEQRLTFAGHVDTSRPLLPDLDRNAEPSADL